MSKPFAAKGVGACSHVHVLNNRLPADPDSIRIEQLTSWLTIAVDLEGREHAVLSDGWHHIRLDIEQGRLEEQEAVLLRYQLRGLASAEAA